MPVRYGRVCQTEGKPVNTRVKGRAPKLIKMDHGPKQVEVVDSMARLRESLAKGSRNKAAASKHKKSARRGRRVA